MADVPLYDNFAEGYDLMTDWQERLASEEAFFRALFADHGVSSLLDTACGTGQHAIAFAQWGLQVTATDLSVPMVGRARLNAGDLPIHFVVAGFGEHAAKTPGPFDAVTCLGNSLPHVLDEIGLDAALADFRGVLRPGGILIIQNNNYDAIFDAARRFMGANGRQVGGREYLFFRFFDLAEPLLTFHVVTFVKEDGGWTFSENSTPQRGWRRRELEAHVAGAGFRIVGVHGSCRGEPYEAKSPNVVIVAVAA